MRKTVVFVMTICFLFCLSTQLPAPPEKTYEIVISITKDSQGARVVDMGEKYAYAVPQGVPIKWTSLFNFSLLFEGEIPFDESPAKERLNGSIRSFERKIKTDAKISHIYKYTVSVVDSADNNRSLMLDPVIIIIPPKK